MSPDVTIIVVGFDNVKAQCYVLNIEAEDVMTNADQIKAEIAASMARVNERRGINRRADAGKCCAPVRRKMQGAGQWGRCERVGTTRGSDGLCYCEHHAR